MLIISLSSVVHGVTAINRTMQEIGDTELNGTHFAVLALGDTAFDLFCEAGIQWDELLEKKGGTRFYDRIDCDTDYEDDADEWIELVLNKIASVNQVA